MTVAVSMPAINLREALAAARARASYLQSQQWFTGDGTTTSFALSEGWYPLHVFLAGALKEEGAGNDYTVTFDGFAYTVVFATAPASAAKIGIIRQRP